MRTTRNFTQTLLWSRRTNSEENPAKQNFDLEDPGQLDRPLQAVRPPLPENEPVGQTSTSRIVGIPPGQPLAQRNRPESLTIKRNRRNRLSRSRTRPTRKTTKSSPIQGRLGSKVTSQRGTRSSYMTPTIDPKKSSSKHRQQRAPKINPKKDGKTTLRNNTEPSIHTMKVRTRSSLPPKHPSLSLDFT
jgi:hypothetical protein